MKKLLTTLLTGALILAAGMTAFAAAGFSMKYLPGATDTVTGLPSEDSGIGGEAYTVSDAIPQREGYEFLGWVLDYSTRVPGEDIPPQTYNVSYQIDEDPEYGLPDDSENPIDSGKYKVGDLVHVADVPVSQQKYAIVNGVQVPGEWTFSFWDTEDFYLTGDTKISGSWTFTPTYVLSYEVAGDPVYGIPSDSVTPDSVTAKKGEDLTLAGALSTAWTTPDGTDKTSYVVYYRDINLDSPVYTTKNVADCTIGSTVTEDAVDVDGYVLVGDEEQSIILAPETRYSWEFSGWYADPGYTTPIDEVSAISADTCVYGHWILQDNGDEPNVIIFYYDEYVAPCYSYKVQYINITNGRSVAEDKIVTDVDPGTHVMEYPVDVPGFKALQPYYEWDVVSDGDVKVFIYYEDFEPMLS